MKEVMIYKPQERSLAHRVCLFFAANRDEELWQEDLCVKWGVVTSDVHGSLQRAVAAGYLSHKPGRQNNRGANPPTYSAGPKIDVFAREVLG